MKYKISKKEFEALSEALQVLYKQNGEDYVLSIEGLPENGSKDDSGLVKKNRELLEELKQFKAKARENEEAEAKAKEEMLKKQGDLEALEKSWNEKLAKIETEKQAEIDNLKSSLDGLLIDNVAQTIASEIGLKGSEALLIPHIKQRLAVEERDGQHITTVRDLQGKPSALTVEDLKQEFIGNAAFAPVIVGSKANGGGASGGLGGAGGVTKKAEDMTEQERIELYKTNPEQFNTLFGEQNN
ncbi:hypothetical protein [Phocoenobacter skyensis]|uniref:Phage minor structural protein GP20 n=1 Tax=Phocoenobacter skyensis TaxID=97481 RepID=A0ABT9JIB8_9PAST|nr:hypothetical protein [Pasteurella skyensis]MDP8078343.1 hypothetical protein [Pasteurella skyensis]MDP8084565.1 hypothetical protein [Pasteurella skyensis]